MATNSARISPTAHYTSFVWHRNQLSYPALATREGWVMFHALRPMTFCYRMVGGPSLEQMLLARHLIIDELLERAITSGRVGQVVEVAAGLSPRGVGFVHRHEELVYVEGDLPGMAARKRRRLTNAGLMGANHHVVDLDALADDGECSIAAVGDRLLDPDVGTAVITEGLLGYFASDLVTAIWGRFADFLAGYPTGLYLSDLNLGKSAALPGVKLFRRLLSMVARGEVHLHFDGAAQASGALMDCGFARKFTLKCKRR